MNSAEIPLPPEEPFEETGVYFEDLEVGQSFVSPGRTVTEADIMAFAGITGDYAMIHTNEEYCRGTEFGTRVAHGLLGLSLVEGLKHRLGKYGGVGIAMASLEWNWSFRKPILPGHTVHVRWTIREKRSSRSKPDRGIIVQDVSLINQRGEVVQQGEHVQMVRRRPSGT